MAAELRTDPEVGLVGADGDGEWMEELLKADGIDIAFDGDVNLGDLPLTSCSLDYNLPAAPWSSNLSSSSELGEHPSTPEEPLWPLDGGPLSTADPDGVLQVLASSPREGVDFLMQQDEGLGEKACRIDVQESQESNKVQENAEYGADSSQEVANSSKPAVDKVKVEWSGGSPASRSGNTPYNGAVKRPAGAKKDKESDSDSDNCAGNRPKVEQEDVEKLQERLMRNRESAQLSRQRKKAYMEEMASRIRTLSSTVSELNGTIAHLHAENASLRHQLAFYLPPGTAPPLPAVGPPYIPHTAPGMRPLYPAPGPIAYGGYPGAVRPGYAPPVPILRLPIQSAASAKKATTKRAPARGKAKESGDGAKEPSKKRMKLPAKAAAGVSAMALFCFAMVIAPASWHASEIGASTAVQPAGGFGGLGLKAGGRVLMSLPEGNGSLGSGRERGSAIGGSESGLVNSSVETGGLGVGRGRLESGLVNSSLVWQQLVNASSPFSIPFTEQDESVSHQLVGDDREGVTGRVMRKRERSGVSVISGVVRKRGDPGWIEGAVIAEAQKAARRIVSDVALQKGSEASRVALMTGSREHDRLKGIATLALAGRAETKRHAFLPASGATQGSEFEERSAGDMWTFGGPHPFLSSGMCTELFHFSDPIVVDRVVGREARTAAEEAALAVARERQGFVGTGLRKGEEQKLNQTAGLRGMGRKWKPKNPDAVPMPPVQANGSYLDAEAGFEDGKASEDGVFGCRNESSSVVVSVMVPSIGWEQAAYDGKKGASAAGKGLSQIFVVVLINSAKYVTYSCSVPTVA